MRLLIVSIRQHLASYSEFVEALHSFGVEGLLVHNLEYCFLCERRPLHTIPIPKLLRPIKRFNPDFVMTDYIFYVPRMVKLVNRRVLFHMRGGVWSESDWDKAMHPSLLMRMYVHYLAKLGKGDIEKVIFDITSEGFTRFSCACHNQIRLWRINHRAIKALLRVAEGLSLRPSGAEVFQHSLKG